MSSTNTLGTPVPHAPVQPDAGSVRETDTAAAPDPTSAVTRHHTEPPPASWSHVRAAQNGDSDAFGRLYDQNAQIVYRYVLFRVSDHSLAEDITSETFLRALRRITSISYQGRDVAAWFITIAKNLILDHIKSSRNRLEIPTAELIDSTQAARPQQAGPEQQVLTDVTHRELLQCVRQLNPDQRECIRLRFLQGMSVTETAAHMQRNEGAIKALQHRAIRRLAQLMPDELR
ncbi:sigma-70 family RNA polymerase sigma factor [Parasphingorhabdus pacifica]